MFSAFYGTNRAPLFTNAFLLKSHSIAHGRWDLLPSGRQWEVANLSRTYSRLRDQAGLPRDLVLYRVTQAVSGPGSISTPLVRLAAIANDVTRTTKVSYAVQRLWSSTHYGWHVPILC
jgi:hypothetical protein